MHKTDIETVRLFEISRNYIVDAEKMREAVETVYSVEDEWMNKKRSRLKSATCLSTIKQKKHLAKTDKFEQYKMRTATSKWMREDEMIYTHIFYKAEYLD